MIVWFIACVLLFVQSSAEIEIHENQNVSEMAIALSQISRGLVESGTLAILNVDINKSSDFNEFVMEIHRLHLRTCIFNETRHFFKFIESNLKGSLEVTSLIFHSPKALIPLIHRRNLAHRLSLYAFFWNARELPEASIDWKLNEPLRVVMITNPRKFVYRVYYNQAFSSNDGRMKLVNWFDGNSLGLHSEPILTHVKSIYENFKGRNFIVPVVHSPPWIFVNYIDNIDSNYSSSSIDDFIGQSPIFGNESDNAFDVSGRDDSLLKILARKMNFRFTYVDVQSLLAAQGGTQPGELGLQMLQRREADLLFGDIVVTYEKMQEVEFSFFTLPDSGAFLTHAPRRLSEAFALVYPFQKEVWPPLIFTIIVVGPILYLLVIIPDEMNHTKDTRTKRKQKKSFHDIVYIMEMSGRQRRGRKQLMVASAERSSRLNRDGLLSRCVWFTCHIFLRQSTNFPHDNVSVRLFSIILWLSSTYVLSDLYSAQLTSQLARPSKELAINTLDRLEHALNKSESYELLVEKNSASHNVLMNGTGIMHRLHKKMQQQGGDSTYLLNSVEEGVQMLLSRDKTVVFAGRQTLYFNMKRFGIKNFQLSEKLFTRYSAISLQRGCLFLDSINENLMKLFEGGILDKITNDEYEKMFQSMSKVLSADEEEIVDEQREKVDTKIDGTRSSNTKAKISSEKELTALNLRMLQGAFYLALIGHMLASLALIVEIESKKAPRKLLRTGKLALRSWCETLAARILLLMQRF